MSCGVGVPRSFFTSSIPNPSFIFKALISFVLVRRPGLAYFLHCSEFLFLLFIRHIVHFLSFGVGLRSFLGLLLGLFTSDGGAHGVIRKGPFRVSLLASVFFWLFTLFIYLLLFLGQGGWGELLGGTSDYGEEGVDPGTDWTCLL